MKNKVIIILFIAVLIISFSKLSLMDRQRLENVEVSILEVDKLDDDGNNYSNNIKTTNFFNLNDKVYGQDSKLFSNDLLKKQKEQNRNNNIKLINNKELFIDNFSVKTQKLNNKIMQKQSEPALIDKIKKYKVKNGDSLWSIANDHNIDIDTLIGANDISDMNKIKPGETIKILPVKGILYKIAPGENLSLIANKFNISIQKIVENNKITNSDQVYPGTTIILPGAKPEFGYHDRLNRLFIRPITTRISSHFGKRWGKMHEGIDFAASIGTNVKAAGNGKVVFSGWARGYGKTIIIEHQKGMRTLYAHNSRLLVNSGQRINRSQVIAKSGNTGKSTGPHLHFEVQVNGRPVDPLNYLR